MSRFKSVCFTINNYSHKELKNVRDLGKHIGSKLRYAIFQCEVAPGNGTPHIQGYACAIHATTLKGWKELLGTSRAHIECARGSAEENKAYCSKEDSRATEVVCDSGEGTTSECGPFEFGVVPKQGGRTDLAGLVNAALDTTKSIEEVMRANPEAFLKFNRGALAIRSLVTGRRNCKTEVFWLYGPTGTGKSRLANSIAPSAYWKQGSSRWWCGYEQHEDVIIDDYRRDLCTFSELLRLFDRYPMQVEGKGVSHNFVAKRLFITTPKDPESTWEGRVEEDLQQLMRRIDVIIRFTDSNFYFVKGRTDDLEQIIGEVHENFN